MEYYMTNTAMLGFALGVLAAGAAILILVPVSYKALRPGGFAKALATGAFTIPLLGLLIFTSIRDRGDADGNVMPLDATAMAQSPNAGDDLALFTHMYMGGPPPSAGSAGTAAPTTPAEGHPLEALKAMTASNPGNAQAWLALANSQRQSRDYAGASASYEKALRLDGDSPDAWADYADAMASAGNRRLSGAPAEAIGKALRLDAKHPKALWLQASLDLEQRKYKDALKHWQALRAALPAGSPDITIVDANIAEARQLAAQSAGGG
jgi:tetratricopeptide (TPR) repeat protein